MNTAAEYSDIVIFSDFKLDFKLIIVKKPQPIR